MCEVQVASVYTD